MSTTELLNAVLQLPIEDRRELIQKACESLGDNFAEDGLLFADSPEFVAEIKRRIDEAERDPSCLSDWEEVRDEVRQRLLNRTLS